MITVCLDARMIRSGGIGTFLCNIIPYLLQDEKIQLTLIYAKHSQAEIANFKVAHHIVLNSPIYSLIEQFELMRKIPACDLYWSPHFNVPLLPIRAKKRLVTIQDVFHLAHFSALTLPQKIYSKIVYNAAFLYSDAISTISTFSKNEILRLAFKKPKNIEVIPLGVRQDLHPIRDPKLQAAVRTKYNLPQTFILSVGNIKPHKNLARLYEAYQACGLEVDWVIVGQKEGFRMQETQLFSFLQKDAFKNRVHVLGYVEDQDLATLYSMASLFVFPSLYEGFGLPPLEAMAFHCPAVVSQAASMPEVCQDAVEYIDPLSIESMKRGIQAVMQNDCRKKELIEKGKKRMQSFSWEKTAEHYRNLIYRVCRV